MFFNGFVRECGTDDTLEYVTKVYAAFEPCPYIMAEYNQ